MLSENIKALSEGLGKHMDTGATLEPVAVATICAVLDECAREAAALEEVARAVAAAHGLPEDILRIATLLARHGVSAGLPKRNASMRCPRCHAGASFVAGFVKCSDTLHCGWIGSIDDAERSQAGGLV